MPEAASEFSKWESAAAVPVVPALVSAPGADAATAVWAAPDEARGLWARAPTAASYRYRPSWFTRCHSPSRCNRSAHLRHSQALRSVGSMSETRTASPDRHAKQTASLPGDGGTVFADSALPVQHRKRVAADATFSWRAVTHGHDGRAGFDGPAAGKVTGHDRHSDADTCVDGMGRGGLRAAAHSRHVPARRQVSHHSVTHELTMRTPTVNPPSDP